MVFHAAHTSRSRGAHHSQSDYSLFLKKGYFSGILGSTRGNLWLEEFSQ